MSDIVNVTVTTPEPQVVYVTVTDPTSEVIAVSITEPSVNVISVEVVEAVPEVISVNVETPVTEVIEVVVGYEVESLPPGGIAGQALVKFDNLDFNAVWADITYVPPPLPFGKIEEFGSAGAVPPTHLICNGTDVSRTTYADLFEAIGTTWGSGNGSTTFTLPNLVDRFSMGATVAGAIGGSKDAIVVVHNHTTNGGGTHVHTAKFKGFADVTESAGGWFMARPDYIAAHDAVNNVTPLGGAHDHPINNNGVSGTDKNLPPFAKVVKAIVAKVV